MEFWELARPLNGYIGRGKFWMAITRSLDAEQKDRHEDSWKNIWEEHSFFELHQTILSYQQTCNCHTLCTGVPITNPFTTEKVLSSIFLHRGHRYLVFRVENKEHRQMQAAADIHKGHLLTNFISIINGAPE